MICILLAATVIPFFSVLAHGQNSGPVSFRKIQLNGQFYSEGINFGDVNHDGTPDIVSGPYWYAGPNYTQKTAFRLPKSTPFDTTGDSDCYLIFLFDFNQDGWQDILSFRLAGGAQAVWYENPKGATGYWTEHAAFDTSFS